MNNETGHFPKPMKAYRFGHETADFPIWDAGGAAKFSGRWNEVGNEVIYAAEHYSTAMLEKLVQYTRTMPPDQRYIEIDMPAGISYEEVKPVSIQWVKNNPAKTRRYGDQWYEECRSAVLIVPSSLTPLIERNFIFHTKHGDFDRIRAGTELPVDWDERLFSG